MNYKIIYDKLINKCNNTTYDGGIYTERHHIIPKCIGGSDSDFNIVSMLPKEHYIAHLLLAKIYEHPKLWYSASIMRRCADNKGNKKYDYIRKNVAKHMSNTIKEKWATKRGYNSYYDMCKHCWELFLVHKCVNLVVSITGYPSASRCIKWWVNEYNLDDVYRKCIVEHKSVAMRNARLSESVIVRAARSVVMNDKYTSKQRSENKTGSKNPMSKKVLYNGELYNTVSECRAINKINNHKWKYYKINNMVKFID